MPKEKDVHFILREPNATKETPISLIYRFGNERLKYATGHKINPAFWDTATQRPKEKGLPDAETKRQCKDLKLQLNRFESELEKINSFINREKINPTLEFYKNELDKEFAPKPKVEKKKYNLITYAQEFIRQCKDGERLQPKKNIPYCYNTYKTYGVVLNRLISFQAVYKKRLDFENINLHFYKEFTKFLTAENYSLNYLGVCIKNVKVFMRNAYKDGYHENMTFEDGDFTKPSEDVLNIYLNDEELRHLFELDLSQNKRLDKVRDIFLIGCFTGLRISDLTQLKPENIIHDGKIFKIKTQKTKEWVFIPLKQEVKEILAKYDNVPPEPISDQKMNQYLKHLGQLAGLTETVQTSITKGGINKIQNSPKYEQITNHTARRSFATNAYLAGIDIVTIMKITGHKSVTSFMKYIKVTAEENALKLLNHPHFNQSVIRLAN